MCMLTKNESIFGIPVKFMTVVGYNTIFITYSVDGQVNEFDVITLGEKKVNHQNFLENIQEYKEYAQEAYSFDTFMEQITYSEVVDINDYFGMLGTTVYSIL